LNTSDFDYDLPIEMIAQTPIEPRDTSRLLVLNRHDSSIEHKIFKDIVEYLNENDLLVINETRVIPARIYAQKVPTGGKVEILLLRQRDALTWEALLGGKGLSTGKELSIESGPEVQIIETLNGAQRLIQFSEPIEPYFNQVGNVPLPPYIHIPLNDPERYQTIYSQVNGSAAAPTAGLHFTPRLMEKLRSIGVRFSRVVLHVGLDTFAPVTENDPREHKIHTEWCHVPEETVQAILETRERGGRVVAVGTTSVRSLESAAQNVPEGMVISPYQGATDLYILPGYKFRIVDAMITNFHLPRSTLLMLVSAFAGRDRILAVYETAKREHYRFYSFGDAMLIV
jgi:S-adenosylmethionine:tRNA ribosyltransferase-isomerase